MIRALKTTADPPVTFVAYRRRRRSRVDRGAHWAAKQPRGWAADPFTEGCPASLGSIRRFTRTELVPRCSQTDFVHPGPARRIPVPLEIERSEMGARRCLKVRRHPPPRLEPQRGGRDPPWARASAARPRASPGPPHYGGRRLAFAAPPCCATDATAPDDQALRLALDRAGPDDIADFKQPHGPNDLPCASWRTAINGARVALLFAQLARTARQFLP
jgi:hypothetical protein